MKEQGNIEKFVKAFLFIIIFSSLYLLILYYPILTLGRYLGIYNNMTFQVIALILMISPLVLRLTSEKFENNVLRMLRKFVMGYGGFSFILLTAIIIMKIFEFFFNVDIFTLGIITTILVFTAALAGYVNAHMIKIKRIIIHSKKIKRDYRFVQLTDVHIGSRSPKFLERVVRDVNHLNPEFVCITGDLVDFSTITYKELSPLKNLKAKTYFVIGNHERYIDTDKVLYMLEKMGIHVLRDETTEFGDIQIIGIDDRSKKDEFINALERIKVEYHNFSLLMYHRPHGFRSGTAKQGIDLQISGHTHKGQIYPFNLFVKMQFHEIQGHYKKKKSHLYVSPGTGTWGPTIRIGSRNEITLFEIKKD